MAPRGRAGWLPSALLLLQVPGERLSPSWGRGGEGAGLELGHGAVGGRPAAGGGEKVPGGAAACLSSEQEGSGREAGEAGPLCWWEGAPVMVTPQQSQWGPPHTAFPILSPWIPLLCEEGPPSPVFLPWV